jgi:hypothetical protein
VPVGALVPLPTMDGAAGLKSRLISFRAQIGEQPGSREVLPDQQAFDGATVSAFADWVGFPDC